MDAREPGDDTEETIAHNDDDHSARSDSCARDVVAANLDAGAASASKTALPPVADHPPP